MSNKVLTYDQTAATFARFIRASGWLLMEASIILDEEFGLEGKMAIRQWLRRWGLWRGRQTRKGHHAMGWEINMENLMKHWDSAAAVTESLIESWKSAKWHPCNVLVDILDGDCPQSDLWREHNFWMDGHVQCDEFHVMYTRGYHPDAICVLPECIMKNDPACTFDFMMPPNSAEPPLLPPYEGEDVLQDWLQEPAETAMLSSLRRKARITAGRIYFLKEVIYERFPERADEIYGKILRVWCEKRGDDLRHYMEEHSIPVTTESLVNFFEHPYVYLWDASINRGDDKVSLDLGYCPFAETWSWLDKDSLPVIEKHYCRQCYKTLFGTADPGLQVELVKCRLNGDDYCRIEFSKK